MIESNIEDIRDIEVHITISINPGHIYIFTLSLYVYSLYILAYLVGFAQLEVGFMIGFSHFPLLSVLFVATLFWEFFCLFPPYKYKYILCIFMLVNVLILPLLSN